MRPGIDPEPPAVRRNADSAPPAAPPRPTTSPRTGDGVVDRDERGADGPGASGESALDAYERPVRHPPHNPALPCVEPHLCGAGCAGLTLASLFRDRSTRYWACEGVILRCQWPRLRSGVLAGAAGSDSAQVAADVRSSRTLLAGGRLVRSRWSEAAERPRQVAQAVVVIGTAGTEGETPSGRALGCVCGPCGAWDILVGG